MSDGLMGDFANAYVTASYWRPADIPLSDRIVYSDTM
jgi:hypothetical protein